MSVSVYWATLSIGFAQTIQMEFPAFAGKTYDFVLFQGDKVVKLYANDTLPKNGVLSLEIPKEYAPYTGMSRWSITNTPQSGGLDMVIAGRGFKAKCLSDQPHESNIQWEDYNAMNELNGWYRQQQAILDKFDVMSRAVKVYGTQHPLYASFQKEKEEQERAYEQFYTNLKQHGDYTARLFAIINLLKGISSKLTDDDSQRAKYVEAYITNELNFDDLYTSGHWANIIQSWTQIHSQVFNDRERFTESFQRISQGIISPKIYTDFVDKVTTLLNQLGRDDFIGSIAPTVVHSGKITAYESKAMQVYVKAMQGMQAPDLVVETVEKSNISTAILKSSDLAKDNYKQTLLVFYQSGCGHCEELMQKLPLHYAALKVQGIRIISISSDKDEALFKNVSKNFPWEDRYRDLKEINFNNYAVSGTPTLVLLNSQGQITQRAAQLEDILASVQ